MTRRLVGVFAVCSVLSAPWFVPAAPAQGTAAPSPALNQATDPLLRDFRWRVIGPVNQGGRVNDIAVVERNPTTFYVGFATGGLWKTTNNGVSFDPLFDTYRTHSIGDLALAPSDPNVLYVGTGEANNRQSSSFGDGVYKSTDGGKTFTSIGLRETQSIARVVVHPRNPDVAWVAAMGHLFGPNPERGLFKTSDGGRTWRKILFVDNNTGATEIVIHPANPDILFAATYQRQRTAWGYASGGSGSALWRSEDGGEHWARVTGGGLPAGMLGRIGIDFSRSNPQVLYVQMEVAPDREPVAAARGGVSPGDPEASGGQGGPNAPSDDRVSGIWRSSDGGQTWEFRSNQNNRPMYYSQVRVDPTDENTVYVGGASAFKSTDGAKTFTQLTGFGHGDHHAIWIDPANSRHVMYGNDGSVDVSWDGGAQWESLRSWAVGQPYHVSFDMRRPYFVCTGLQDNGSWCGPSSVRSGAILAEDWYRVGGGDGFYSAIDPTDHTVLYTESQNGNMSRLDLAEGSSTSIRPWPGGRAGGGGGGAYRPANIVPAPDSGTQIRWNWSTPIVLSPHNAGTILTGGNRFFVSRDRGATWTMSPDLTKQVDRSRRNIIGIDGTLPACGRQRVGRCNHSANDGTVSYGTITTVGESPVLPGVYWVGTDDGNIQVSRDGGTTWTEVSRNLPGGGREYYVSRVEPSHTDPASAYVSLDGHRSDDLEPYVFVTRDYGKSWTSLSANLPAFGHVNTVRQDPRNRRLLYVGTEFGFYVSLDEGGNWKPLMTNLPVVRIDDVAIHPRDNDLILATHGRSLWIMDDVSALQGLTAEVTAQETTLFEPRDAILWKDDIRLRRSTTGARPFRGETAPEGTALAYHLKTTARDSVRLVITDLATGSVFRTFTAPGTAGLHRIQWDLCSDLRPAQPGQGGFGFGGGGCGGAGGGGAGGGGAGQPQRVRVLAGSGLYKVTLRVDGKELDRTVRVVEDRWMR